MCVELRTWLLAAEQLWDSLHACGCKALPRCLHLAALVCSGTDRHSPAVRPGADQRSAAVQVVCDGQEIDLPHEVEGILVINIPSYMGGVALWAHSSGSCMSASPQPQSFSDGMVEVRQPLYVVVHVHLRHLLWLVGLQPRQLRVSSPRWPVRLRRQRVEAGWSTPPDLSHRWACRDGRPQVPSPGRWWLDACTMSWLQALSCTAQALEQIESPEGCRGLEVRACLLLPGSHAGPVSPTHKEGGTACQK